MSQDVLKSTDTFKAREFLLRLCHGEQLTMRIPADEDDYDLVFDRVIRAAERTHELRGEATTRASEKDTDYEAVTSSLS